MKWGKILFCILTKANIDVLHWTVQSDTCICILALPFIALICEMERGGVPFGKDAVGVK